MSFIGSILGIRQAGITQMQSAEKVSEEKNLEELAVALELVRGFGTDFHSKEVQPPRDLSGRCTDYKETIVGTSAEKCNSIKERYMGNAETPDFMLFPPTHEKPFAKILKG